jgi:hypothetical protein
MTDKETEPVKQYPEASLLVATLWKRKTKSPIGCLMFNRIPQGIRPPKPNVRNDPNQLF